MKRGAPMVHSKLKGKIINVSLKNIDDYCIVQKFFLDIKVQYQLYVLKDAKPLRLVFRKLPINTAVQDIVGALELEDFLDVTVTQMNRDPVSNKRFMPIFYISIPKETNVDRVF